MTDYPTFLAAKLQHRGADGFEPTFMPDYLYGFQSALTEWAVRMGRGAIFADCGLGKTPMQLVWAENVRRHTGKPVLILTPLAVATQTIEEAAKFGIEAAVSRDGKVVAGITVSNYQRLHHFDREDYAGVVCDESSALKSFDGETRRAVTDFMHKMRYRLLCTATAAPNDYIELGTSSEALGELGHLDMLGRFFKNDQNNTVKGMRYRWSKPSTFGDGTARWRFKGHAEEAFWRWVASWARALRKPSDLGFEDADFLLPDLIHREHIVEARTRPEGTLFDLPAIGLREERDEQRRTIAERCETAASLVDHGEPAVVWCHLNEEGDRLARLIPDAEQVKGSDSLERKEELLTAFSHGQLRVLVTKPKIGAWGLNWQHAAHMTFFPSHSYEQYYQAVRRMWRFGQKRQVVVDIVATEGSKTALANLKRKSDQADRMFAALVLHMNDVLRIEASEYTTPVQVPSWMGATAA